MSDEVKEQNEIVESTDSNDNVKASGFIRERGLLTEFHVFQLHPNLSDSTTIPLTDSPKVIASLTGDRALRIDDKDDRVWLTGTVGWQAKRNDKHDDKRDDKHNDNHNDNVVVLFKIFRGSPDAGGELIFSTRDSAEEEENNFVTTSFIHVDTCPFDCDCDCPRAVSYFLTAELTHKWSAANVIGPITFTGAEIECNPPHHDHCR